MLNAYLAIAFTPLLGALITGLGGHRLGKRWSHRLCIGAVAISFLVSAWVFVRFYFQGYEAEQFTVYTWGTVGNLTLQVGFLVDELTSLMMMVVTFVSLMVHIYTIGYMREDPGYSRFFAYIALFTFAMLMLVMANNFLQLFFGWEAVGLVSYLLIGFWYKRETAIRANLKAFLVNRVGDFGFLLGIAGVFYWFGSLDYLDVFGAVPELAATAPALQVTDNWQWPALTFICICLFIGAMGKSAQVPLHVWLPDSMEGPTPISALIHAATMVTAGVFMVARMSPIFEYSETALAFVLVIGSITALSMGLVGIVQQDIKRVVAYSTLSQLGYMVVALGVSAYSAAIFHLFTHAFFKALLFLGAGAVIIALHHEQDIRKMGGLRKALPITYFTFLIGTLALVGTPLFAGFYSKDAIIAAVGTYDGPAAALAEFCVLAGVFVTALYSFRLLFVVFHGKSRVEEETRAHLREPASVVWMPLVLLAIPSLMIGWWLTGPLLFGEFFGNAIKVLPAHDNLRELAGEYHGAMSFALHGLLTPVFWLMVAGLVVAWIFYSWRPAWPARVAAMLAWPHRLLINKYYADQFNQKVMADGSVGLGRRLWQFGDGKLIDGMVVHGLAGGVAWLAGTMRRLQTGYLYHYAFVMMGGLLLLLGWLLLR